MTESPLVDSCLAVLVFSPGDDLNACLNKEMAFLTAVASLRFPSTKSKKSSHYSRWQGHSTTSLGETSFTAAGRPPPPPAAAGKLFRRSFSGEPKYTPVHPIYPIYYITRHHSQSLPPSSTPQPLPSTTTPPPTPRNATSHHSPLHSPPLPLYPPPLSPSPQQHRTMAVPARGGLGLVLLTPQGCLFGVVSSRRRRVSVFGSQPKGRLFLGLTALKGVFVSWVNSPKGVFVSWGSSPKQGVFVLGAAATRVRLCGLAPQGSVWSVGLSAPLVCVRLCGVSIKKGTFGCGYSAGVDAFGLGLSLAVRGVFGFAVNEQVRVRLLD
nr:hypothetical protein [Tanacetum cinerariifolium]